MVSVTLPVGTLGSSWWSISTRCGRGLGSVSRNGIPFTISCRRRRISCCRNTVPTTTHSTYNYFSSMDSTYSTYNYYYYFSSMDSTYNYYYYFSSMDSTYSAHSAYTPASR